MATYRKPASTETQPKAPVTAELMSALANNPDAIAEGAPGAPPIEAAAFGTLTAGTTKRAELPSTSTPEDSNTWTTRYTFNFVQPGNMRIAFDASVGNGNPGNIQGRIVTTSEGGETTSATLINTSPASGLSFDFPIVRCSVVEIQFRNEDQLSASFIDLANVELRTGGENIFPTSGGTGLFGRVFNSYAQD